MTRPTLFHTLVIMGAALAGGGTAASGVGCGSSDTTACDPQKDSSCTYATIHAAPCDDASGACYGHISTPQRDAESDLDGYAHIAFDPDAYAHIAIDSAPLPDASDGSISDGSDSG